MVTKATVTSSKTVDFSFRGPLGFEARTVLLSVESDSPDQMAFESTGGNLDVMGLAEFTEIRPNCTEVTLALHYEIKNKLFAWLDRRFHFVDAFVTSELAEHSRPFRRNRRAGRRACADAVDVRDSDGIKGHAVSDEEHEVGRLRALLFSVAATLWGAFQG